MEQKCGECKHFIRHYIKSSKSFNPIDHGHCTYPMIKNRTIDHMACTYFEEKAEENKIHIIEIEIKHRTL